MALTRAAVNVGWAYDCNISAVGPPQHPCPLVSAPGLPVRHSHIALRGPHAALTRPANAVGAAGVFVDAAPARNPVAAAILNHADLTGAGMYTISPLSPSRAQPWSSFTRLSAGISYEYTV